MRKYKVVSVEKLEVDEIICNGCGKKIHKNQFGYFEEHLHVEKSWEYSSKRDGEKHSFDLCQDCYEKLIHSFKFFPDRE